MLPPSGRQDAGRPGAARGTVPEDPGLPEGAWPPRSLSVIHWATRSPTPISPAGTPGPVRPVRPVRPMGCACMQGCRVQPRQPILEVRGLGSRLPSETFRNLGPHSLAFFSSTDEALNVKARPLPLSQPRSGQVTQNPGRQGALTPSRGPASPTAAGRKVGVERFSSVSPGGRRAGHRSQAHRRQGAGRPRNHGHDAPGQRRRLGQTAAESPATQNTLRPACGPQGAPTVYWLPCSSPQSAAVRMCPQNPHAEVPAPR